MGTHEISSSGATSYTDKERDFYIQVGHVLGEFNRQHGWHACEETYNGHGNYIKNWACGEKSGLASYMWLAHQYVGDQDRSNCTHKSWNDSAKTKSFTAEPDELARGVLRPVEPHFGFRCPACAAFAQHGWKYDAVAYAIQPLASPHEYRAPFLKLIDKLSSA